ncbi:MAG: dTDP-4-dehydrorhamnose 3,5-epimerase family protein [Planctomycetes bacterium]|nr:dTDP-4-dehydrorhamnose 3,5-epimerase family protein [Planctomycetota bacterium]
MKFTPTTISGAFIVDPEPIPDERGFFARTWCREEFRRHGLTCDLAQTSISFNHKRGTVRGMHYQAPPAEEAKLIHCSQGAIYDVILDLRPESPTFLIWEAFTLTASNRHAVFAPEGVAHGFQTLEPNSEVHYQISVAHVPERSFGFRHDDPTFGIAWPLPVSVISERDQNHPSFTPARLGQQQLQLEQ